MHESPRAVRPEPWNTVLSDSRTRFPLAVMGAIQSQYLGPFSRGGRCEELKREDKTAEAFENEFIGRLGGSDRLSI